MPHVTTASYPSSLSNRWFRWGCAFVLAAELALSVVAMTPDASSHEASPISAPATDTLAAETPSLLTYASTESMPWGP